MRASGRFRAASFAAIAVAAVMVLSMLSGVTSASFLRGPQSSSASTPVSHSTAAPVITTQPATKAAAPKPATATSPHPGTLDIYEANGDGTTVDPSAAYYTVNAEPIWNVYETLIAYNGSDAGPAPTNFVPQGATCVPGSTECLAQFGQNLVYNNATGVPTYYTFEIDGNARFYDPATSVSWPVFPSDVVFSLARTLAFADYPGFGVYNGWINAQDVLPAGNSTWDGGLHSPYNNTPSNILSAFIVNDSAYCPTSTVVVTNGCVTWNVSASGLAWPYILELIADPMGASIQSCGWATNIEGGANDGAPDFAGTTAANGDGPCTLPGGYTSSTQSISGVTYSQYVASLAPTSWDAYELLGGNYPSPQANLQWNMVGSGPYYNLNPVNPSSGYFLRANPAYAAPQGCAGQIGCLPLPGHYEGTANIYWSSSDTPGLEEMSAGYADTAGFFPTDVAEVKSIVSQGNYALETGIPTISIYFDPIQLNFSLTALKAQDTVGGINVPGDFLSNVGLREFLVNAFPYATDEATIQTIDGVEFGEHYGGMIPIGMGNYYPTNISWPGGNPVSNPSTPGNVSWWWTQLTTSSSPWYDPTFAACTSSSPCKFPFVGIIEGPTVGLSEDNWIASIESLTGDAVQPYQYNIHAEILAENVGLAPGQGNMPIYSYGWAPDYPDPTDYLGPMYYPDATYTYVDATYEQMVLQPAYNNPTACGHTTIDPYTSNYTWAWNNLTYWASGSGGLDGVGVADQCQGIAYMSMVDFMEYAGHLSNLVQRGLIFNVAEFIANELALYMYWDQALGVVDYGIWINPAGINTNVMIGGGADQLWAFWTYSSNFFDASFTETGLPTGTSWSVTVGGVGTASSVGSTISFSGIPNGTYPYSVAFIATYAVAPASGTITIKGADVATGVTFSALTGTPVAVTFAEVGLVSGTNWTLTITNVGAYSGNNSSATFALPPGTYSYSASTVGGYTPPSPGSVTVSTSPITTVLMYTGVLFATYPITFTSSGLPTGQTWGAVVNGYTGYSSNDTNTFYQRNGTFSWSIPAIPGLMATPSSGVVTVTGASQSVAVSWTIVGVHYEVTFVEGGLPTGTSWTVNINGRAIPSTQAYVVALVVNGTFSWTVNPISGYVATPLSGTVVVSGASPASIAINFAPPVPTYNVVFTASGASIPAWVLFINGATYSVSASSSTTITLPAGTYNWGVTVPAGYYATPAGGLLTVTTSGASQSFTVTATTSSTTTSGLNPTTGLSTLAYALIGIFVLLTVVFLVTTLMARRRPPSNPPQSWSPGTEGKEGGDSQSPPPSS